MTFVTYTYISGQFLRTRQVDQALNTLACHHHVSVRNDSPYKQYMALFHEWKRMEILYHRRFVGKWWLCG